MNSMTRRPFKQKLYRLQLLLLLAIPAGLARYLRSEIILVADGTPRAIIAISADSAGIDLSDQNEARWQFGQIPKPEARRLVEEALNAWEQRDRFAEGLKDDYVAAHFWIKYNDTTRTFNPTAILRRLAGEIEQK